MKPTTLLLAALGATLATSSLLAIEFAPFGAQGQGGSRNGQSFRIGPAGSVFELDAFVHVAGLDLNGDEPGLTARLSRHALPAGLSLAFAPELSADGSDLVLRYTFANSGADAVNDLRLYVLLDVEIAEAQNTFFNEQAQAVGTPGVGPADAAPDFWQIDEPGFAGGTLYQNLLEARLTNRSALPEGQAEDIALALGFSLGTVKPGETVTVRTMLSEDDTQLGSFALLHTDPTSGPATRVTFSGEADRRQQLVTDLTSLVSLRFEWRLNQPVGSLLGRLRLQNRPDSQTPLGPPFQLGLQSSTSLYYVRPTGRLDNGTPYLDLTDAVATQLGAGNTLLPGQEVTLDNVEIYSAGRLAPPPGVWSLWGTRLTAPEPGR
jgi:hypothetical protein